MYQFLLCSCIKLQLRMLKMIIILDTIVDTLIDTIIDEYKSLKSNFNIINEIDTTDILNKIKLLDPNVVVYVGPSEQTEQTEQTEQIKLFCQNQNIKFVCLKKNQDSLTKLKSISESIVLELNINEYIETKKLILKFPIEFGNIQNEIQFTKLMIKLKECLINLETTVYANEIYYFISDMHKTYEKVYNVHSHNYSLKGHKLAPKNLNNLTQYLENSIYIKPYWVLTDLFDKVFKQFPAISELYRGLSKYITGHNDYSIHLKYFIENKTQEDAQIYLSIPLATYCVDEMMLSTKFKFKQCFDLNSVNLNKLKNKKIVIVTSCEINYFKKYFKFLLNTFLKYNSEYLLIIDIILTQDQIDNFNESDQLLKYILDVNIFFDCVEIIIKPTNEQNLKAYSSVLRLIRVNDILKKNKKCMIVDIDSVFCEKLNEIHCLIGSNDILTRELYKVYPWQKYTCGFVLFNNTLNAKLISDYICYYLNEKIHFGSEQWWIDQNALEVSIRRSIIDANILNNPKDNQQNNQTSGPIKITNIIATKDNYILSPTGNENTKLLNISKKIGRTNFDNIIVFAHPDDETIFFWDCITSNSLLVLVTNYVGTNRHKVLLQVQKHFNCSLICLSEPDEYKCVQLSIQTQNELLKILLCNEYERLMTHNEKGEYGHTQHIAIYNFLKQFNPIVTSYDGTMAGGYYRYLMYINCVETGKEITSDMQKKYDAIKKKDWLNVPKISEDRNKYLMQYSECHTPSNTNYLFFLALATFTSDPNK